MNEEGGLAILIPHSPVFLLVTRELSSPVLLASTSSSAVDEAQTFGTPDWNSRTLEGQDDRE